MYPERYVSEMQDTCGIHTGYRTCKIHVSARVIKNSRYMRDTSEIHDEIHVSQIHPDRYVSDMKETCGIHAGYMRDTCILRGNQDTCGIHAEYMRDTCGAQGVAQARIPARPQVGLETRILICIPMYPYMYVSDMYLECILCVMYLRVKIHCIWNVSGMYLKRRIHFPW